MSQRPLGETLGVHKDLRLAAIGGGGKMTLLMALGLEWAQAGGRPLLLPTTRIADHAERGVPGVRTVALPAARTAWSPLSFLGGELLVVGRRGEKPGLLESIHLDEISGLAEQAKADLVLIKADGARGRSLKAHDDEEPLVPLDAGVVVALAGVDAWGAPLGPEHVHHDALFADRWGIEPGTRLEDDAFYAALADPGGYRASLPPGARYVVFLNQVDRPVRIAVAQRLAQGLNDRGVAEVVWGDLRRGEWTLSRRER
ncbi:MAG: selenium cofactor biosynthesis protein YqeC [Candidatus Eisenbacteria bacterium]